MRKLVLGGVLLLVAAGIIFFIPPTNIFVIFALCLCLAGAVGLFLTKVLPQKACLFIALALGSFAFLYLSNLLDLLNLSILLALLVALGINLHS